MNKLEKTKYAAKLVVGFSVSYVVGNAIKNNTVSDTAVKKTEVIIAAFVIGSLVSEHAEKHVEKMIDSAAAQWSKTKEKLNTN